MLQTALAITSPLLDITISGAKGVLFNVKGSEDLALFEVNQAAELIRQTASPDANIIFGAVIDEGMGDEIQITVIATGFDLNESADITLQMPISAEDIQDQIRQQPFDKTDVDIPSFLRRP